MSDKPPKKASKKKGLVIPKMAASLPAKEVRWSFPGDLWSAIEQAAKNNDTRPDEVVRFILSKGLRTELAGIRRDLKEGKLLQEPES